MYVGDVAKAVEVVSRDDLEVVNQVGGKIIEAGGPEGMSVLASPSSFTDVISHSIAQYSPIAI